MKNNLQKRSGDIKFEKVLGIVAEYNPFHSGHVHHIEVSKRKTNAEAIIAIMSGNFTQRGELAISDKWTRAEMATKNGVDLVVELPFYYACNSAEYFARGGVNILESLGCVTDISFGTENEDIYILKEIAKFFAKDNVQAKPIIDRYLKNGNSYPKARELALKAIYGENIASYISQPNNILAIEYLKALGESKSNITPIAVERCIAKHNENTLQDDAKITSGTAIRNYLRKLYVTDEFAKICDIHSLPEATKEMLQSKDLILDNDRVNKRILEMLRYKIFTSSKKELQNIFSISEGLEGRFEKYIRSVENMREYILQVKSKRYTYTRIQRAIIHIIMGFTKEVKLPKYARILAFNEKGAKLIKYIKKNELNSIPIIEKIDKYNRNLLACDIKATDIFNLITDRNLQKYSEYGRHPIYVKN